MDSFSGLKTHSESIEHLTGQRQNQSLRYAIHQLKKQIGMVAPSAHHIGSTKSAISPNIVKTIQKIFRSTALLAANLGVRLQIAENLRPRQDSFQLPVRDHRKLIQIVTAHRFERAGQ